MLISVFLFFVTENQLQAPRFTTFPSSSSIIRLGTTKIMQCQAFGKYNSGEIEARGAIKRLCNTQKGGIGKCGVFNETIINERPVFFPHIFV